MKGILWRQSVRQLDPYLQNVRPPLLNYMKNSEEGVELKVTELNRISEAADKIPR